MRTTEITTTQNVTIRYELASLRERATAWAIDIGVLIVGLLLLMFGFDLLLDVSMSSSTVRNVVFTMLFLVFVFYTLVLESNWNGQTIGKRILGLKVMKLDGKQATVVDYTIRWIFRSIDIYFSVGSLGSILISSSSKSQRLGGLLSNTAVVKVKPSDRFTLDDILKINSIENYEPTYPDVRHISEADMLVVKNTLERSKRYANSAHQKALGVLAERMTDILGLPAKPADDIRFLKTLVSDYVVLTR